MRIYGTSPLFNLVELVFRCKWLFIVAVVLGAGIASVIMASRSTKYNASIIVSLSGEPELASGMTKDSEGVAERKRERLEFWLRKTPTFLASVINDAGLASKYDMRNPDVAKKVGASIADPTLVSDQYMEVSMTWADPAEAVSIMNALFSNFRQKTADTESATYTNYRTMLETQFAKADRDADVAAQARIKYTAEHFWTLPSMMGQALGTVEDTKNQMSNLRLDLADATTRLVEIDRLLAVTPKEIVQDVANTVVTEDQTKTLRDQLNTKQTDLIQAQKVYSSMHPKVRELQQQIAALQTQITEAGKQKPHAASQQTTTHKAVNPAWQDLSGQKQQLEVSIRAQQRRLNELSGSEQKYTARVSRMGPDEIGYEKVDRAFSIADSLRKQLQTALAAARVDEERQIATKLRESNLVVEPKAVKLDSNSKAIVFVVLGGFAGILVAFCFALGLESLDHTLRTPVEVEKYLGKPVLAVIPRMQSSKEGRKRLSGSSNPSITS